MAFICPLSVPPSPAPLTAPSHPPEASGQPGTPGLSLPPGSHCPQAPLQGQQRNSTRVSHGPCFAGRPFRKNRPSESSRTDGSHLSLGGRPSAHMHPAPTLVLDAWMNAFLSEMLLLFASGQ